MLFPNQRREEIVELLKENGSCRVQSLAENFKVTEQTIRQDLELLEQKGIVNRLHGGASLANYSSFAETIQLERKTNMECKTRIGKQAATFIKSGDNIIIDSGTTTTEMAKHLADRKNLNIVTPALNLTLLLGKEPTNNIIMTGGEFKAPTLSLTGPQAVSIFSNLFVDKLFLATGGFSISSGLSFPSFLDIPLKKAMIDSAQTIYLLADSSKIEKTKFAVLGKLEKIDYLITDDGIDPSYVEKLKKLGIKTIVC
ncbi:MAG: DeoR/GlpR family DNA-binding transcription regulator [Sphaerochaetaceae bacterium]|nr:DeoR/GlpR family DNA-binding transcription regulator [Sphaerochaetaceae bacterium]